METPEWLADIEPDWDVIRCIAGPDAADEKRQEWDRTHGALPVWGCFRTVGVNRVRHQPHDWVQGDQAQTRYHCDGAE